ncbi:MAG: hypothetical protein IT423_09110 [Pirellulaceae bacterium]|nr:hypothetical protein [Pirellulaceae bacterium]
MSDLDWTAAGTGRDNTQSFFEGLLSSFRQAIETPSLATADILPFAVTYSPMVTENLTLRSGE